MEAEGRLVATRMQVTHSALPSDVFGRSILCSARDGKRGVETLAEQGSWDASGKRSLRDAHLVRIGRGVQCVRGRCIGRRRLSQEVQ